MASLPDLPDLDRLRNGRKGRLLGAMRHAGVEALLLTNPVSIRYATDYHGYFAFQSHIPTQYLLLSNSGRCVLFGGYTDALSTIDEVRPAHSVTVFDAGFDLGRAAQGLARDVGDFLVDCGLGSTAVVGVERLGPSAFRALSALGNPLAEAEVIVERARSIKTDEEVAAMRRAVAVTDAAMGRCTRPASRE